MQQPAGSAGSAGSGERPASSSHPWAVLAAALVGLQALVVAGGAVFYLVELVVARPAAPLDVAMSVLLFLVAGAGLALVARGVLRRRRWARAPAVTWELVCLPVAYGLVQSGRWYVGLPLALVALTVLAAVLLGRPQD